MNKDELISLWEKFAESSDYFQLNPDRDFVSQLAEGVLENEKNKGFRFCPCRVSDGTREKDISLLCPCNFKVQDTWMKNGRCWCGLFVRKGQEE